MLVLAALLLASAHAGDISVSVTVNEGTTTAPASLASGTGASTMSSASFAGIDPVMFSLTLGGQPVPWMPHLGAFVLPDMRPGKHQLVMYRQGAVALRADFTTEAGRHSICTVLVQPLGYDTSCAEGGRPLTAADIGLGGGSGGIEGGVVRFGGVAVTPEVERALPMSESSLQALIAAVEDASFADDQVSVLRTAAAGNHFTCAQVLRLLEPVSFSDSKVEAVTALRLVIVDPQNSFVLEQAFTFSSDKEALRALFR